MGNPAQPPLPPHSTQTGPWVAGSINASTSFAESTTTKAPPATTTAQAPVKCGMFTDPKGAGLRDCPAGSYCLGGASQPIQCRAGSDCSIRACNDTAPCPKGSRCPLGVPVACSACSAGYYRGRCGPFSMSNGPCWKCKACSTNYFRAKCGGTSAGTCYKKIGV